MSKGEASHIHAATNIDPCNTDRVRSTIVKSSLVVGSERRQFNDLLNSTRPGFTDKPKSMAKDEESLSLLNNIG